MSKSLSRALSRSAHPRIIPSDQLITLNVTQRVVQQSENNAAAMGAICSLFRGRLIACFIQWTDLKGKAIRKLTLHCAGLVLDSNGLGAQCRFTDPALIFIAECMHDDINSLQNAIVVMRD